MRMKKKPVTICNSSQFWSFISILLLLNIFSFQVAGKLAFRKKEYTKVREECRGRKTASKRKVEKKKLSLLAGSKEKKNDTEKQTQNETANNVANPTKSKAMKGKTFLLSQSLPSVNIIFPSNSTTINQTSFTAEWDATYDSLDHYEVKLNTSSSDDDWKTTSKEYYHFSEVSEDKYYLWVKVIDGSGAEDLDVTKFWVDYEAPQCEITSINQRYQEFFPNCTQSLNISTHEMEIYYEISDSNELALYHYKYRVVKADGYYSDDWYNSTRDPLDLGLCVDGHYTVYLRAMDKVGKTNTTSVSFTIDTHSPHLNFLTSNNTFFTSENVTVTWNATDDDPDNDGYDDETNGTGIKVFQYQIDGGNWTNKSDVNIRFDGLSEGEHNLTVRAWDWTGWNNTSSLLFTIDMSPPTLLVVTPDIDMNPYWSESPVNFTCDTNDKNFNHTRLYINGSCNETYHHTGTTQISVNIEEGVYEVYFVSMDLAGNGNESRHITLKVDTTFPLIEATYPQYTNSQATTVEWNYTDNFQVNLTQIKIDENNWTAVLPHGNHTYDLTEGNHTISFKVTDLVNHKVINTGTITVDLTLPSINITEPTYNEWLNSSKVTMKWNGSDLHIDHYEVRVDEKKWLDIGTSTSKLFSDLSEGEHTLSVKAIDKAGNNNQDITLITIDVKDPSIEIKKPSRPVTLQSFNLTWESSDSVGIKKIEVYLNDTLNATYYNTSITLHEFQKLPVEFWKIKVMVCDHVNHTATDSILIETRIMTLSITNLPTHYYTKKKKIVVKWEKEGRGLEGIEVYLNNKRLTTLPWSKKNYTVRLGENSTDGNYFVTIRLYDRYGNSVKDAIFITLDRKRPEINILSPNHTFTRETIKIAWNGSDINTTEIFLNLSRITCFNATITSCKIDLFEGKNNLLLRASDKAGNTANSSFLVVYSDVIAPSLELLNPENNTNIKKGEILTMKWKLEDNYHIQNVTLYVDGELFNSWKNQASCKIKNLKIGKHTIKITVSDKAENKNTIILMILVTTRSTGNSSILTLLRETLMVLLFLTMGIVLTIKGLLNLKRRGYL